MVRDQGGVRLVLHPTNNKDPTPFYHLGFLVGRRREAGEKRGSGGVKCRRGWTKSGQPGQPELWVVGRTSVPAEEEFERELPGAHRHDHVAVVAQRVPEPGQLGQDERSGRRERAWKARVEPPGPAPPVRQPARGHASAAANKEEPTAECDEHEVPSRRAVPTAGEHPRV